MIIRKSNEELDRMRQAGRIVAETISSVVEAVRPGVTTADLDRLAESIIRERGATPSFLGYKGTYPATICASIDDEKRSVTNAMERPSGAHAGCRSA